MAHTNTRTLKTISDLCNDCQKRSSMVGLLGYPGDGKSFCLDLCVEQGRDRFLVRLGISFRPVNIFQNLADQMGLKWPKTNQNMYDLLRAISNRMDEEDEPFLVIIGY